MLIGWVALLPNCDAVRGVGSRNPSWSPQSEWLARDLWCSHLVWLALPPMMLSGSVARPSQRGTLLSFGSGSLLSDGAFCPFGPPLMYDTLQKHGSPL